MKFAEIKDRFNFGQVVDFCRKNIRYISAAVVVVILIVVLAVTAARSGKDNTNQDQGAKAEGAQQDKEVEQEKEEAPKEQFEVDAIPEINALIQNYYAAYVAGDVAALEGYATPISELEKNYIGLMSQYLTAYENVKCNTKAGLNPGEYGVSVVMDVRFEGVETTAPGLDFFYVRQNAEGAYYIDNLYSQFNLENNELEMDSQVKEFIAQYEKQEDMAALSTDVQARYDAALAADENLRNRVDVEIPQAIKDWVTALASAAGSDPAAQNPQPTDPAAQEPQPTDPAAQEPQPTDPAAQEPQPTDPAAQEPQQTDPAAQGGEGQANYVPEGSVLTASKGYNVRESMSEEAERLGTTAVGDEIKVVMSYAEGWTKVEWKDKAGYIRTDLLLNN